MLVHMSCDIHAAVIGQKIRKRKETNQCPCKSVLLLTDMSGIRRQGAVTLTDPSAKKKEIKYPKCMFLN